MFVLPLFSDVKSAHYSRKLNIEELWSRTAVSEKGVNKMRGRNGNENGLGRGLE